MTSAPRGTKVEPSQRVVGNTQQPQTREVPFIVGIILERQLRGGTGTRQENAPFHGAHPTWVEVGEPGGDPLLLDGALAPSAATRASGRGTTGRSCRSG